MYSFFVDFKKSTSITFRLEELVNDETDDLFGCYNFVDLMLCRTGQFLTKLDWQNEEQINAILQSYVCSNHKKEFHNWNNANYAHCVRKCISWDRYKICSVPNEIGETHGPIHENLKHIQRSQAEAILYFLGVLLPIGLRKHVIILSASMF